MLIWKGRGLLACERCVLEGGIEAFEAGCMG